MDSRGAVSKVFAPHPCVCVFFAKSLMGAGLVANYPHKSDQHWPGSD